MNETLREVIDRRLDNLKVTEKRKEEILELAVKNGRAAGRKTGRQNRKRRRPVRLRYAIPLTVCFCLLFSIMIAAAPRLREKFFHLLSPQYEEIAPPVSLEEAYQDGEDHGSRASGREGSDRQGRRGSVSEGIHMEVTGAVTDGTTMVMFVELEDQEGRLDDTVDIYDYSLSGYTYLNTQLTGYDEETRTAKFCLLASGGEAPKAGRIRYRISSLLTGKREIGDFDTGIRPESLFAGEGEAKGRYVGSTGGGGDRKLMERLKSRDEFHALEDGTGAVPFRDDIGFVTITNAGWLDGFFHIQTKWEESVDNHGDVYLLDSDGGRIPSVGVYLAEVSEAGVISGPAREKQIEYVYDLGDRKLESCTLHAFFVESGTLIEGDWGAEFTVSSLKGQSIETEGKGLADRAVITPLGIYLYDTSLNGPDLEEITVKNSDGSFVEVAARFTDRDGDKKNLLLVAESPVDIKALDQVIINGVLLYDGSSSDI